MTKARETWPPRSRDAAEKIREDVHHALSVLEGAPDWIAAEYREDFGDLVRIAGNAYSKVGAEERANKVWQWDGTAWTWIGKE